MNDAASRSGQDGVRTRMLRRLRRHGVPLSNDTVAPVTLPPVRLGLLTKFQALTAGLVFLTDATKDDRSAILARRQAREGRRQAETLLRLVREGDRAPFDDTSFGPVVGTYR